MDAGTTARLDDIVTRLRTADWKGREAIKEELLALAHAAVDRDGIRDYLENARKGLTLELRWDLDEVIEAITPPPPAKVEEPKKEDPNRPLTQADLTLVYDDPRGLVLYRTKKPPDRWFATQADPRTGQPQTFELHAQEVAQLKTQLAGSPYWVLGATGAAKPPTPTPTKG